MTQREAQSSAGAPQVLAAAGEPGDEVRPGIRVVCGDSLRLLWALPASAARVVFADPPYFRVLGEAWDNQWPDERAYLEWSWRWMAGAGHALMPGGLLFCCGQPGKREQVFLRLMAQALERESPHAWRFHDLVVWDRCVGANERRDSWTPAYEMILVLRKDGAPALFDKDAVREPYQEATIGKYLRDRRYKDKAAREAHLRRGKYATNLWRIPSLKGASSEKAGHPCQKPLALVERIVRACTAPGELVVDPFLGSGTTALACARLGRRCVGIEVSARFCAMARGRLQDLQVLAEHSEAGAAR